MYGAVFQPMVIGVNRVSHVFRGRQGRQSFLLNLWLANCYFAHNSLPFPALLPFFNASSRRPFHPLNRRPDPVVPAWRRPFPRCRVPSAQTPAPDRKSLPATIAQSILVGPLLAGWMALLIRPTRLLRAAIVRQPSTLLALHKAMSKRKYRMLFSPNRHRKPGPKGSSAELIHLVVEMKQRNPNWGCPRIAQEVALAFHIQIDKDVVRRILARHYRPGQDSGGPSWLTFLGHMKDSLWSMDLFRCESATMRTHWVLVVMDQYTRRIIGFGVHAGTIDGAALCRMFNRAIRGQRWMPNFLSSDNDPLYRFHQWQANLRILEVTEIKSVPYVPMSHPFVERLIGTVRREYLDHILFWTTADLENKLLDFRTYFNNHRTHDSLEGRTPDTSVSRPITNLRSFGWQPHCRSLFQTPMAA
jgi:putative transposase